MAAVKNEVISAENSKGKPLFIFYDCEASNSQVFTADIIEIAARCYPEIRNTAFESLINTNQELGKFTVQRCGIKESDLEGKPMFDVVFKKFLNWIQNLLKRVSQKTGERLFPVLCAHNGYGFDYTILLSNMKRYGIKEQVLKMINLHFADTFQFCKELREEHHVEELQDTKLSMDSLFSKFCPGKQFLNRHRAMGDVNAMIEIFSKEPFKTAINNIDYATSESLFEWFTVQRSEKEQRILLEEKMAKLDAYTRNVYSKKLFQLQLTYDALQAIFENCCSFMDFYETLQDRGIDRKTAKHFACQFGGVGLKNQGTEPYCNLPKSEVTGRLDYSLDNVDSLMQKETERPPNVPPLPSEDVSIVSESSECWDDELDESRSFSFTIPKSAVPLSLTIDDFVATSSSKPSKSSRKKYSSKHKTKDSEYSKSKPVDKIENRSNQSEFNDPKEKTSVEKPNTKPNMSREEKPEPTDVFRNETSSLQVETLPNKKELDKELLEQVGNVRKETNSGKYEVGKQSKDVNEANNQAIPKTDEFIITGSEKSEITSRKSPRKFLRKMKRKSKEKRKRNSDPRKESSSSGAQGNTIATTMKENKKESEGLSEAKNTVDSKSNTVNQESSCQETELDESVDISAPIISQSFASILAASMSRLQEITVLAKDETKMDKLANEDPDIMRQGEMLKLAMDNKRTCERPHVIEDNDCNLIKEISGVTEKPSVSLYKESEELNSGNASANPPQHLKKKHLNEMGTISRSLNTLVEPKEAPSSNNDLRYSGVVSRAKENVVAGEQDVLCGDKESEIHGETPTNSSQQDTTILQQSRKMKQNPEIIERNNGERQTAILVGKEQKQKKTFKKIKQNCKPVVFVNRKSIDEKQKNWPRVEIFVGDLAIQIPVDPNDDDRIEEKFDPNPELKGKPLCNSSAETQSLLIEDSNSEYNCQCEKAVQVQDSVNDKLHFVSQEDPCEELETQPAESEQSLHGVTSDGELLSNVDVIDEDLSQGQRTGKVDTIKEAENELQRDLICENVTPSRRITEIRKVTIDTSQQTELELYNGKEAKKLVDQEQQTDCAFLSTFITQISHVQMQDKETLTAHSRRPQSTDTLSSYDSLSDLCGTSPSSPLYPCDIEPHYDINCEVLNSRECESPLGAFHLSMSPHHENRYPQEGTLYPDENTQYLKEDAQHPAPRYEIPSPEDSKKFFYAPECQQKPGVYDNLLSNPNVLPERFHPFPTVPPPIYPPNPNSVPVAAPLFHQRFPRQYFPETLRLPGNTSNILRHQYHAPFRF